MAGCHRHQTSNKEKQLHARRAAAGNNQQGAGVVPACNKNKRAETELSIVSGEAGARARAPVQPRTCANLVVHLDLQPCTRKFKAFLCGLAKINKLTFKRSPPLSGPPRRSRSGECRVLYEYDDYSHTCPKLDRHRPAASTAPVGRRPERPPTNRTPHLPLPSSPPAPAALACRANQRVELWPAVCPDLAQQST